MGCCEEATIDASQYNGLSNQFKVLRDALPVVAQMLGTSSTDIDVLSYIPSGYMKNPKFADKFLHRQSLGFDPLPIVRILSKMTRWIV